MTTKGESTVKEAAEVANKVAETNTHSVTLDNGDVVHIYVCKAKNVGVVLTAVVSLMDNLGIKTLGELPEADFTNPTVFLKLIANSSEDIFAVTAELCSVSLDYLLELELDELVKIITQVVTINKGFFLQKMLPLLPSGLQQSQVKKKQSRRRK